MIYWCSASSRGCSKILQTLSYQPESGDLNASRVHDKGVNGIPVAYHEADIWLHCNQQNQRDIFLPDENPFPIRCTTGVGIYRPNSLKREQPLLIGSRF